MKKERVMIGFTIVIIIGLGVVGWYLYKNTAPGTQPPTTGTNEQGGIPSGDTLHIEDLAPGTGPRTEHGQKLTVHYRGTLGNGTEFDSSYRRNEPFTFILGAGEVIRGWDQGILGMQKGGKRKLIIPPSLAYGTEGRGSIPPNATLTFEVELLEIAR